MLFLNFELLLIIAKKGALSNFVQITTVELAQALNVSQQTASRWLQEAVESGEIERSSNGVKLSSKSKQKLKEINAELNELFTISKTIKLKGSVMAGLGEGAYYLSRPGYVSQIKSKIGFEPFAGTLDIRLESSQDVSKKLDMLKHPGIRLESFKEDNRFFGGASCYPCLINGKIKAAILQPDRTHHGQDVVELIAPANLRKTLKLENGSPLELLINE